MILRCAVVAHAEPAWPAHGTEVLTVELSGHGLPGVSEDLWVRPRERAGFEVCCIPFFLDGVSLGDTIDTIDTLDTADTVAAVDTVDTVDALYRDGPEGGVMVLTKRGRRTIRLGFSDGAIGLVDRLRRQAGCLIEVHDVGTEGTVAAIDLADDAQAEQAVAIITGSGRAGPLVWTWADPAG